MDPARIVAIGHHAISIAIAASNVPDRAKRFHFIWLVLHNPCKPDSKLAYCKEIPTFATHRRKHGDENCPAAFGPSPETWAKPLTSATQAAEYFGLITLELRRNPRDQKLVVIRADPRVIRPTSLSSALGMDTPTALYRLAVNAKVEASHG